MSVFEFCDIKEFQPSTRTIQTIKEMNRVMDMSQLLRRVVSVTPLFQIFAGRNTYTGVSTSVTGYNISTYDWKTYQEAMLSIPNIARNRLTFIAANAELISSGKDANFWRCVGNAL